MLPGNVTGVPLKFHHHPFCYIDWKEEAQIHKQAALQSSIQTMEARCCFYMDFGYMRASTSDYTQPNKATNRVVYSWDGYSSYLLVVDEATQYIWVFLTKSKDPPLDIVDTFLKWFAHVHGGSISTGQGGERAQSFALSDLLLRGMSLSQQAPIVPHRMVLLRYTMANWPSRQEPSCTDLAYPPNTGGLPSYMRYTSIIILCMTRLNRHLLRASINLNPTSATSKYLALGYA
jgi:hypothetical protein